MQAAFEMTNEYLKTRVAVRRPDRELPGAQAPRGQDVHRARAGALGRDGAHRADMARARVTNAATTRRSPSSRASPRRAAPTPSCSIGNECVQMHGGIGVTDEADIGFFFKRARVAEMTFGDAALPPRPDRVATRGLLMRASPALADALRGADGGGAARGLTVETPDGERDRGRRRSEPHARRLALTGGGRGIEARRPARDRRGATCTARSTSPATSARRSSVTDHLDMGGVSRWREALTWLRYVLDRRRFDRKLGRGALRPARRLLPRVAWTRRARTRTASMRRRRRPGDAQRRSCSSRSTRSALRRDGRARRRLRLGLVPRARGTARASSVHGITLSREQHGVRDRAHPRGEPPVHGHARRLLRLPPAGRVRRRRCSWGASSTSPTIASSRAFSRAISPRGAASTPTS